MENCSSCATCEAAMLANVRIVGGSFVEVSIRDGKLADVAAHVVSLHTGSALLSRGVIRLQQQDESHTQTKHGTFVYPPPVCTVGAHVFLVNSRNLTFPEEYYNMYCTVRLEFQVNLSDYPPIQSGEQVDLNAYALLKFQLMTASKVPASPQNVSVGAVELLEGRIEDTDKPVYLLQTTLAYALPVPQCDCNYCCVD